MIFILHSEVDERSIGSTLGKPEYSYFFVLDGFRKSLERLGTVVLVQNPAEDVDKIYDEEKDCIFLSFGPPNHAPVGLRCPSLTVFAWEFSTIPYETWDEDPRNDWRYVLGQHGRAITLSSYSSKAVSDAMGDDFPVATIPVPVWDDFDNARSALAEPWPEKDRVLQFRGSLLDSRNYSLEPVDSRPEKFSTPVWDGQDIFLDFTFTSPDITRLSGFYAPEEWGAWTRGKIPVVELPVALSGIVGITLEGHAFQTNVDRDITVTLGSSKATVRLTESPSRYHLEFVLLEPATQLSFRGLRTTPPPGSEDKRTLGMGLAALTISRIGGTNSEAGQYSDSDAGVESQTEQTDTRDQEDNATVTESPESPESMGAPVSEPVSPDVPATDDTVPVLATEAGEEIVAVSPEQGLSTLTLTGVVYTSVFNPADGRKNWIDMVTAFCYANREHENATLVLKMVTGDPNSYMGTLHLLLPQLAPFKCRVVAIRGFLPQDDYESLITSSTYYVNASHCEGLCLPLMEFLSAGVPAVSPDHTAMADYINDDLAFRVSSSVEQNVWPNDPRDLFRALRYRINWESLRDAYAESYRVAMMDPGHYRKMSLNAREQMRSTASIEVVTGQIAEFLGG